MSNLNSKHIKTLDALKGRSDVSWDRVKALLVRIGASIENNDGSRVTAKFNGAVLHLHKPHGTPSSQLTHQNVRSVRNFLKEARIL